MLLTFSVKHVLEVFYDKLRVEATNISVEHCLNLGLNLFVEVNLVIFKRVLNLKIPLKLHNVVDPSDIFGLRSQHDFRCELDETSY